MLDLHGMVLSHNVDKRGFMFDLITRNLWISFHQAHQLELKVCEYNLPVANMIAVYENTLGNLAGLLFLLVFCFLLEIVRRGCSKEM